MSPLTPDLELASLYMSVLDPQQRCTFQTFPDKPGQGKARILHGSFDKHADELTRLNREGSGILCMLNEGDGRGRRNANVISIRALFGDFDGAPLPASWALAPTLLCETSAGHYHSVHIVSGISLEDYSTIQVALARHFGADESVKDRARVARLPGFFHQKREPFMVKLLELNDHPPYEAGEVFAALPFLADAIEDRKAHEDARQSERLDITRRAAERWANPTAATEDRKHAQRLLQAHHDTLAAVPEGGRNAALCRHSYTLGGYVAAGYLEPDEVEDVLLAAAVTAGLPEAEAKALIPRAIQKGMAQPLELNPSPFTAKPVQSDATHARGVARFFADGKGHNSDPCKHATGIWGRAYRGVI